MTIFRLRRPRSATAAALLSAAATVVAAAVCVLPGTAGAQTVYRSVGPDGKVTYSDAPPARGGTSQRIELPPNPPPVDPAQGQAQRAQDSRQAEEFLRRGREQAAAFDKARAELAEARKQLDLAKQRLQDGAEPLPGERLGSASGGSRLGENYFERQKLLEQAVKDAEDRVTKAQRQVNDLR